jgi:hypothetical protein
MKIENCEVYGFRRALYGMRAPMESWDKSDTTYYCGGVANYARWYFDDARIFTTEDPVIGPNDLKLALKLVKAGPEHRKFLRQIQIWVDFTLPLYIWSELDTYQFKVRNSCSTMHRLGHRDLTQADFELSIEDSSLAGLNKTGQDMRGLALIKETKKVNELRREYKNKLPSGFLLKSVYSMSYEATLSMFFQRRHHNLPEWRDDNPQGICSFIKALPYMKEFIEAAERKEK